MGDPRQKTSPRPPHPATVAQRAGARAPHPATVPRASIVQRFRAPSTRAPHPATVSASVVQRADNNRFALLNQVTQQNELKPAYARKLKAEAEKKDAEAAAREKARAEAKKRAELEQKRKEKAMRAQQQQRERKAARVEQSVGYEQDGSIDGRSHLDLEKACQLYAGQHGDDRTLERNVKFTTAMSTQTGRTCSRPSGVLTLSGLQGMSKRFHGTISGVKQRESWPPHACAEVYATAALLQEEPQLKLKEIVYYTMDRKSELVPMCENCKQWISGTFNP